MIRWESGRMMTTDGLVVWLCSQLDQDEVLAREAGPGGAGRWRIGPGLNGCAEVCNELGETILYDDTDLTIEEIAHIARHDPASVLAGVAAKRRILDRCAQVLELASDHHTVESCDEEDAVLAEAVVRMLAVAYVDRPGYREEWRPEPSA